MSRQGLKVKIIKGFQREKKIEQRVTTLCESSNRTLHGLICQLGKVSGCVAGTLDDRKEAMLQVSRKL